MKTLRHLLLFSALLLINSCDNGIMPSTPSMDGEGAYDGYEGKGDGAGSSENGGNNEAGRITAGEWCDLDNWGYWSNLMQNQEYSECISYWGIFTNNRVAVRVFDSSENPQVGVKVNLLDADGNALWHGVTDNHGEANLFAYLTKYTENANSTTFKIQVGEDTYDANVTSWKDSVIAWNDITYTASPVSGTDILFIVDATGSMGDEITFLKDDLLDILNKANVSDLRTGALFYRDEGDEYITKPSQFSDNVSTTVSFIKEQNADGGGDWPEAVHTALNSAIQDFSWRENARTKLAFMVLDAPPHYESQVLESVYQSIAAFAKMGVQIIPIAASGIDKNTEFLLRDFAITTNGTYVFITNHSGIGNEHIEATVGDYEVELLNALMLRLIKEYTE